MKFFKHKKETQKEEEIENFETISLSDLQMNYEGNESPKVSTSSQDFFEFLNESSDSENYTFSDIIFCGKIIRHENDVLEHQEQNLSPLFRSNSFHRPVIRPVNQNRANSARFYGSQNLERVNISGLTSMSAKSRRRMFMFGPVKFNPEMELSEIKQRQGRRRTVVIPRSEGGGDTAALVKSRKKKKEEEGGPTGKLMELTNRPHFVNVLVKSLRCFSLRKHCMGLP